MDESRSKLKLMNIKEQRPTGKGEGFGRLRWGFIFGGCASSVDRIVQQLRTRLG